MSREKTETKFSQMRMILEKECGEEEKNAQTFSSIKNTQTSSQKIFNGAFRI